MPKSTQTVSTKAAGFPSKDAAKSPSNSNFLRPKRGSPEKCATHRHTRKLHLCAAQGQVQAKQPATPKTGKGRGNKKPAEQTNAGHEKTSQTFSHRPLFAPQDFSAQKGA